MYVTLFQGSYGKTRAIRGKSANLNVFECSTTRDSAGRDTGNFIPPPLPISANSSRSVGIYRGGQLSFRSTIPTTPLTNRTAVRCDGVRCLCDAVRCSSHTIPVRCLCDATTHGLGVGEQCIARRFHRTETTPSACLTLMAVCWSSSPFESPMCWCAMRLSVE